MNWPSYNQSLVRRGEILLGFHVINNWDSELKQMNKEKIGEPFHYPNTFLLLLGYAKHIFIFLTGKPRELHKVMLKEKYLPSLITLQ
jgi:hypothetical protein